MTQDIYQKQYTLRNIVSESWKRFTENFWKIFGITVMVYFPGNIILAFIPIDESVDSLQQNLGIIQVYEVFVGVLATMAIAYIVKNTIDGKPVSASEALKKSLSRWGAALGTYIVLGIFLFGLMLLIVPGIIYGVYWMFVILAVILNDKSGKDALDYSKAIVMGRWWTVARYTIALFILIVFVGLLGGIPSAFLPDHVVTSVVSDTFVDVILSYSTVAFTIFYINFDATKRVKATE